MTVVRENLEWHDNWALERHYMADISGDYLWTLYERVSTGLEVADKNHPARNSFNAPLPQDAVIKLGKHPVHGGPTLHEYVWMPRFRGSEEYIRLKFEEVTRGK